MTKKDYELIARVIIDIDLRKAKGARIAELFADGIEKENPRFNREIFINSCTLRLPCLAKAA